MSDNKIIIKKNFPQQYHHVVGKNISFTPDEANVDDLMIACALPIIYFVWILILCHVRS